MSGVLQPVGPEPARTYWIRRGILLAVVLLVVLGVVLAVGSLTKAAVATAPPPAIALAPDSPSPSAPAEASTSSPTPASSPSRSLAPAPTGVPSASTSAKPSATAATSTSPSAQTPASTSAKSSSSPAAKPRTTTTIGTPDCKAADVRVTLKGDRSLSPGENNKFRLSLINGGTQSCLASVTDKNFELKIYSGKDRIWSSRDCAKVLADFDRKLPARADVDWVMTWNGERSIKGKSCRTGTDTPRAGTYWATAHLTGADPVQLRMILR